MKDPKRILVGCLAAIAILLGTGEALAQSGFGISPTSAFLKRTGNVVTMLNSSWQFGDSSNRIAAVYTTLLDATTLSLSGAVTGDQVVNGNQTVYGSGGVTALSFYATTTGQGLRVDGRSLLTGMVTTTAGITPLTAGGGSVGSAAYPFSSVYATGTAIFGGTMAINNGTAGNDWVQIGYEQSPAKVAGDTSRSYAPLNIYASSTGFQDAFTMTAGGNGVDGACFSAKNLSGTLGRQCQTSSPLSYWIMASGGIALQSANTTPYNPTTVDLMIRDNKIGIGTGVFVAPNTKLEVVGQSSSTSMNIGGESLPSSVNFSVIGQTVTSTVQVGNSTKATCLVLGDIDKAGVTYCTALNGVLTCSMSACNP